MVDAYRQVGQIPMRQKILLITFIVFIIMIGQTRSDSMNSTNYFVKEQVSIAAGNQNSSNYFNLVNIHENVIGYIASTNYKNYIGFLYGTANETAATVTINLTFGPPGITLFRVTGCGPKRVNSSAIPEGQNATYGIDKVCSNAVSAKDLTVQLSGTPAAGWQVFASNTSDIVNNTVNLTGTPTTAKKIYSQLGGGNCTYIWYKFGCYNITSNPGVYEIYNLT